MKILGLSCSPRKQGNTSMLLDHVLTGARQEGSEVDLYSVSGKNLEPCRGCKECWEHGECRIDDDMRELQDKMLEADGIIFGTPVYFYNMTAQAKAVVDRTIALNQPDRSLANKVGGVVVVGGSLGLVDALKDIYFYFITRQVVPANYIAAYALAKGDVQNLDKCMNAAENLGRQMVKIAANKFRYPEEIGRSSFAYGTHTR